jgi:hypothetical protein
MEKSGGYVRKKKRKLYIYERDGLNSLCFMA